MQTETHSGVSQRRNQIQCCIKYEPMKYLWGIQTLYTVWTWQPHVTFMVGNVIFKRRDFRLEIVGWELGKIHSNQGKEKTLSSFNHPHVVLNFFSPCMEHNVGVLQNIFRTMEVNGNWGCWAPKMSKKYQKYSRTYNFCMIFQVFWSYMVAFC